MALRATSKITSPKKNSENDPIETAPLAMNQQKRLEEAAQWQLSLARNPALERSPEYVDWIADPRNVSAREAVGEQLLVADPARLVVRVAVATAAAERGGAGIVGVAQVVGRRLGAVLADLGAGHCQRLVGGI